MTVDNKFQAGVGPDMKRCHIRRVGDDPKMSLCKMVCIARDYKADFAFHNPSVCLRCANLCLKEWKNEGGRGCPPAEYIGVSDIQL